MSQIVWKRIENGILIGHPEQHGPFHPRLEFIVIPMEGRARWRYCDLPWCHFESKFFGFDNDFGGSASIVDALKSRCQMVSDLLAGAVITKRGSDGRFVTPRRIRKRGRPKKL